MIVVVIIIAYLLGSLPSAVLVGKLFYNTDVREHGSGNAGATNTFRVLGKKAGIIVFILDFGKGVLAASMPQLLSLSQTSVLSLTQLQLLCGLCVVVGHIFPLFAGFRGGKGVATTFGVFVAVFPISALICVALFFILLIFFHFVSVGSIIAIAAYLPLSVILYHEKNLLSIIVMLTYTLIIIIMHRKNIERLMSGTENKMYLFKSK
jgi:acyl phosphate:glycerol-3-phosphate acyltransferase